MGVSRAKRGPSVVLGRVRRRWRLSASRMGTAGVPDAPWLRLDGLSTPRCASLTVALHRARAVRGRRVCRCRCTERGTRTQLWAPTLALSSRQMTERHAQQRSIGPRGAHFTTATNQDHQRLRGAKFRQAYDRLRCSRRPLRRRRSATRERAVRRAPSVGARCEPARASRRAQLRPVWGGPAHLHWPSAGVPRASSALQFVAYEAWARCPMRSNRGVARRADPLTRSMSACAAGCRPRRLRTGRCEARHRCRRR